jgi:hypothetical protein
MAESNKTGGSMPRTRKTEVDALLTDIVGQGDLPAGEIGGENQRQLDPIESLIAEQQYNIPRKASATGEPPLTFQQTKEALTAMSEQIGDARRKKVVEEWFPKLLAESEELYGPDNLTTRFLRAAVTKDKAAMREVIKLMDQPYKPAEN